MNEYIWLIFSIILFTVEALTVNLFTIWFGIGALVAMIATLIGANTVIQLLIFAVVSVILLVFTRPLAVKGIKKTPTNSDSLIGKNGIVTKEINNIAATGEIKVGGKYWTARSEDETIIEAESVVEIIAISGVKLIVKQINN